ncbi:MAG: glycosyltransferase family 4 protein [bacterium]|nr:glycosyltransferase family 4 protein [bacterium]
MVIFLPIKLRSTGGTSSFAQKLQTGLQKLGHTVIFSYETNYDILLASPTAPWKFLFDAKKRGKPIVQRLDGVYYPTTTASWLYPLYNTPLFIIHHFFTDYTIYQSKFSLYCCNKFLGKTSRPHTIIYNGVDTDFFSNIGNTKQLRATPNQNVFITASRFRRLDQINPVIAAFKTYLKKYNPNSKLVVVGNFTRSTKNIPSKYRGEKNIDFVGIVENKQLPAYLRAADVFVFTHLNPPCPNNVVEALSCGLPIAGIGDGAMPELVSSGHEAELIRINSNAFYKRRAYNLEELAKNMHRIINGLPTYKSAARNKAISDFALNKMSTRYLKVFESLLE